MLIEASYRKAIENYYAVLDELAQKQVSHEQGLRPAMQNLLATVGKKVGWTLVPEQRLPNGKVPDGTLRDTFLLPRGYWEAKDTADDLDNEVKKKIAAGYPLSNIIFEDTHRAVLYQDGQRRLEAELRKKEQLADLLHAFTTYAEPDIEQFEQAVTEFKARIPELAQGVLDIIARERKGNKKFVAAFSGFHELCRQALDPRISEAQIDEMLVQHLLTERLFRTVFDNSDFAHRNAIAAEIEKVIGALTSRSFSRAAFLKSLDRFYVAIEDAARGLEDFSEKQHFLNTVYERFFQGFSVRQADTMGIVYTPQEIVDFMCASVDEVLKKEFSKSLSTPGVKILDPCTGTGNFVVNILRRINRKDLPKKYAEDIFCNEIMLLPYYIASLNIEHEYYQLTGEYKPFPGICFTDTLELAELRQLRFEFNEENSDRVKREKDADITVIIGNPPYNVGQQNENDNNKNRRYPEIERRVRESYAQESKATNKNALSDAYVKFFRWATDRLKGKDGLVCFVSNNSFVDQLAFDGMRKCLLRSFTDIYHIDLHGNVRKNPRLSGTTHNVFGIQVGVGITIAIKNSEHTERKIYYHRVPENWTRWAKCSYLAQRKDDGVPWVVLQPDRQHTWLTEGLQEDFTGFIPVGTREGKATQAVKAVFRSYGRGVATCRDDWAYDYHREKLSGKIRGFIDTYNSEVDRWLRRKDRDAKVDDFVLYDDKHIKWSETLKKNLYRGQYISYDDNQLRNALYRPFCSRFLYFDTSLNERTYQFPAILPTPSCESENVVIVSSDHGYRAPFSVLATSIIPDLHLIAAIDAFQCFPFYTYNEDGSNRRENITDWALAQYQARYGAAVTKWDIFHYVYALLHHPAYRERYAENLKRELPRIPYVPVGDFPRYVETGRALADLHLHYESAPEYPLAERINNAIPFSWRVQKMKLTRDKYAVIVNDSLTLAGIPPEVYHYRLGNRSALEWVIDQYQVTTDKRSGITSDPNREDDPEYIVRLLGRVVTVSLETVKLVDGLPKHRISE
ncbi:MAG: type ISP restriction/modification enzyme [Armatimonadota bacterium]